MVTVEVEAKSTNKKREDESHHDVIKRILFIFAKLNPGVK